MNLQIRREMPEDYRITENIIREAFWNMFQEGCDEHYLMHVMRESEDYIPELTMIAQRGEQPVAAIAYTRSRIEKEDGSQLLTATFGPMGVLPKYQRMGIGRALINHTLCLAREMNIPAILILGDPDYYGRLGFKPAEDYGIRLANDMYIPALQLYELKPKIITSGGRFKASEVYDLAPESVAAFDKSFPEKEKFETETQKRFRKMLEMMHE
jgi:predicted N-acetyltransferase YhbS